MKNEAILGLIVVVWLFFMGSGATEGEAEDVQTEVDRQSQQRSYYPYD